MDKRDLAAVVASKTGVCRVDVERVITVTISTIREAVIRGEKIVLRGFGTFGSKIYKAQTFTNPKKGHTFSIGPRRLPSFRPVKSFLQEVRSAGLITA